MRANKRKGRAGLLILEKRRRGSEQRVSRLISLYFRTKEAERERNRRKKVDMRKKEKWNKEKKKKNWIHPCCLAQRKKKKLKFRDATHTHFFFFLSPFPFLLLRSKRLNILNLLDGNYSFFFFSHSSLLTLRRKGQKYLFFLRERGEECLEVLRVRCSQFHSYHITFIEVRNVSTKRFAKIDKKIFWLFLRDRNSKLDWPTIEYSHKS